LLPGGGFCTNAYSRSCSSRVMFSEHILTPY
jgi:hypothetical protein